MGVDQEHLVNYYYVDDPHIVLRDDTVSLAEMAPWKANWRSEVW